MEQEAADARTIYCVKMTMPLTDGQNPGVYMWDEGVKECTRDGDFVTQYKNHAGDVID